MGAESDFGSGMADSGKFGIGRARFRQCETDSGIDLLLIHSRVGVFMLFWPILPIWGLVGAIGGVKCISGGNFGRRVPPHVSTMWKIVYPDRKAGAGRNPGKGRLKDVENAFFNWVQLCAADAM